MTGGRPRREPWYPQIEDSPTDAELVAYRADAVRSRLRRNRLAPVKRIPAALELGAPTSSLPTAVVTTLEA